MVVSFWITEIRISQMMKLYLFGVLNVYQVKKIQKMTEINDNYYSVHSQIFVIFSTYPNNAVIAPNIN